MSGQDARDVIAATINDDGWTCDVHEPSDPMVCPDCWDSQTRTAQKALDELTAAGFAVVKLPEPVHRCDRDAAWITPDGEVYQVDFDRRNGIWVSDRTTTTGQTFGPTLPSRAHEVAAALLAATAYAEAGERDDRH